MGTTPVLLLPYPAASDPADVPLDMQELADRIEAVRGATNGLASLDATGKVPAAQLPATVSRELAYAQITSTVICGVGSEAAPTSIVATSAFDLDGSPIWVEFYAPGWSHSVVHGRLYLGIYQGAGGFGTNAQMQAYIAGDLINSVYVRRRLTPAAAAGQTFSIRGWTISTGLASVQCGSGAAGALAPAFIRVSRAA